MLPLIALVVLAANPTSDYNRGNQLYARKDYGAAALAYQEALKAGPSAAVHFNLGNALFKSGRIGPAIVHYRRARYLAPRDADVATNLNFARAYRVDKTPEAQSPLARAVDDALHRLSRREAGLLAPLCFALGGAFVAAWIVRRWVGLLVLASVCGLATLYGFLAQQTWASEFAAGPAVVVVPEVNALSGPSEEFQQVLLLHDGTEVRIREARGDYLLVQLAGGGGWVPKGAVERVY
ncbi:MAG: tetratricopeptide repeat protein [Candidatus Eiseniibacteriota bacterium]